MTAFSPDLPRSLGAALGRGIAGHCPRCGATHLFARFLKPVPRCGLCGQDWTLHAADDFPPYIAILITGHVMAPLMILLGRNTDLSALVMTAIALAIAVVMLLGLLQPAKGGVIALQWWLGMHGFAQRPGKVEAGVD